VGVYIMISFLRYMRYSTCFAFFSQKVIFKFAQLNKCSWIENWVCSIFIEQHIHRHVLFFQTSLWCNLDPNQIIGTPAVIKEIDCLRATVDEICTVTAQLMLPINVDRSRLSAYAGWFDVQFKVYFRHWCIDLCMFLQISTSSALVFFTFVLFKVF
jgi:hypothetical protein